MSRDALPTPGFCFSYTLNCINRKSLRRICDLLVEQLSFRAGIVHAIVGIGSRITAVSGRSVHTRTQPGRQRGFRVVQEHTRQITASHYSLP